MEKTESTIKLPIISFFNIRDFLGGIAFLGLIVVVSLFFFDFKGPGNELSWLPLTGIIFLIAGAFLLYNSESSVVVYLQKGNIQNHFVCFGKALSRTIASKSDTEAIAVDCQVRFRDRRKTFTGPDKIYEYPVFLIDKARKKHYIAEYKNLEEANRLVERIAAGWQIKGFTGKEKSFAILGKGPKNSVTITYSSSEPLTAGEKIPSSLFWFVSITMIILASMFVMSFLLAAS